ncbi:MAG: CBS domain-containing protein, partial [Polaromonas sp.]|nr:CBS domain-containing protein [Polaromonas sp.]
ATRIVLLDQGRIVQSGTPLQILSAPANDFVTDFFGRGDVGIKLLGLQCVATRLRAGESADGEPVLASLSLRDALSVFLSRRVDRLPVVDSDGEPLGVINFHDLLDLRS